MARVPRQKGGLRRSVANRLRIFRRLAFANTVSRGALRSEAQPRGADPAISRTRFARRCAPRRSLETWGWRLPVMPRAGLQTNDCGVNDRSAYGERALVGSGPKAGNGTGSGPAKGQLRSGNVARHETVNGTTPGRRNETRRAAGRAPDGERDGQRHARGAGTAERSEAHIYRGVRGVPAWTVACCASAGLPAGIAPRRRRCPQQVQR